MCTAYTVTYKIFHLMHTNAGKLYNTNLNYFLIENSQKKNNFNPFTYITKKEIKINIQQEPSNESSLRLQQRRKAIKAI